MFVRPLLFALVLVQAAPASTQVTPRRAGLVVRIPIQQTAAVPVPRLLTDWKEGKGPRCVTPGYIAGARIEGPKAVDFILRDRSRLRARLSRTCPALDYYSGFYLRSNMDGLVCRDRDAVHARSGGECEIDAFRTLTPRAPKKAGR